MTTSSLLLGACIGCGEPIFRHRVPSGRQLSCERVRQIDQALQSSGRQSTAILRPSDVLRRRGNQIRQERVR